MSPIFYACYNKEKRGYMKSFKKGMSTTGYAIIFVIVLGIIMIISAPMMADKYKTNNSETENQYVPPRNDYENYDYSSMEQRIMNSVDDKIRNALGNNENSSVSDKYVCSIEGVVDSQGNVRSIDRQTDLSVEKIVFVCQYRH